MDAGQGSKHTAVDMIRKNYKNYGQECFKSMKTDRYFLSGVTFLADLKAVQLRRLWWGNYQNSNTMCGVHMYRHSGKQTNIIILCDTIRYHTTGVILPPPLPTARPACSIRAAPAAAAAAANATHDDTNQPV